MVQQVINLGAVPNDGTGDPLRTGGTKINANFSELYASGATYTPPFTGAVATTVAGKLAQVVSVLDFGADPTGATDSTTAILTASANPNLFWPPGTYLVGALVFTTVQNWFCMGAV